MSAPVLANKLCHATAWLVGTAVLLACWLVAPGAAWAQQACDDSAEETLMSMAEAMLATAHQQNPKVSPVPDIKVATPCSLSQYDSPSYNVCYATNPRPISTMPKWLAELQAEDAVRGILATVDNFSAQQNERRQPLSNALSAAMVAELIDFYEKNQLRGEPRAICVEGIEIDSCEAIPPASALVFSNATIPVVRPGAVEEPPFMGDLEFSEPPLVELRVGPSAEHRTPPDRPPPA